LKKQLKFKRTEIGRIPNEWEIVQLEKVIKDIKNGFASGKRDNDGIIQVRMNNVTTDGRLIFDTFLKVPTPENINDFLLKEGDFLFNNTNSIDLVGKSAIFKKTPFPCTFSNHFTRIRLTEDILPEWVLFHFITLWRKGFFKSVAIRHVGQSAVQTKFITNINITLPPLPEQQKTVEILTTVDEAIEKVSETIEKTQRLKKGLMHELLTGRRQTGDNKQGKREFKETEIGRIPKEWEVRPIGEVAETSSGGTPSRNKKEYFVGNIPWVKSGELKDNIIYDTEEKITEIGLQNSSAKLFPKGTLLIALYGATVGKTGILGINATSNQAVCAISSRKDLIDQKFLQHYLIFRRRQLISISSGGAQPNISQEIVRIFRIPLPPLPEQQKIAEILSTIDKKLELLKRKKERFERIKRGLMDDLLTGRKRVSP